MIAGIGRTEYHLMAKLRLAYRDAVGRAREKLGCDWDIDSVSLDLAGNQVWWRTRDLLLDGVPDNRAEPMFLVRSNEVLRPRSASRGSGIGRRVNPAASVSSVNGVGAKKPCPTERRLVQPRQRIRAETRGLKKAPY